MVRLIRTHFFFIHHTLAPWCPVTFRVIHTFCPGKSIFGDGGGDMQIMRWWSVSHLSNIARTQWVRNAIQRWPDKLQSFVRFSSDGFECRNVTILQNVNTQRQCYSASHYYIRRFPEMFTMFMCSLLVDGSYTGPFSMSSSKYLVSLSLQQQEWSQEWNETRFRFFCFEQCP